MENSQRKANARNGFILKLQLMFLSNKLRSARMIISNFLMMENMFEIEKFISKQNKMIAEVALQWVWYSLVSLIIHAEPLFSLAR